MQPETNTSPEITSTVTNSILLDPSSQYGSGDNVQPDTSSPDGGADSASRVVASNVEDTSHAGLATSAPRVALRPPVFENAGKNVTGTADVTAQLPPIYNRVASYEQSGLSPARARNAGPAFEVIRKPRRPDDKRCQILELPSEVLIHALAHLGPSDLASIALVSRRFHTLVTGPHAWRSAFAHFFPGHESIDAIFKNADDEDTNVIQSERRVFTRLTAIASWRSEYIIRTRLLRSLARGRPALPVSSPSASRSGQPHTVLPTVTYSAHLFTTINHIHANFGSGLNKRLPRFVHGAHEIGMATMSDPAAAKVESWGLSDPQQFLQFVDRFPGDSQYGLGPGEIIGAPNVMDVSQPYGMIYGEGSPGGGTYYRCTEEMRGRLLLSSAQLRDLDAGIPRILPNIMATTAVWIAKSSSISSLTDGLLGMLVGTSMGILTAYSQGTNTTSNSREQRFARGEMTARWVLCPGVPIIAIAVDNEYTLRRHAENRIWAVVLNALGEVFYVTKFPTRQAIERNTNPDAETIERLAWQAGRSIHWKLVENSRRVARNDPYGDLSVDASYSPRSSWSGMCLSKDQLRAETMEIETFLTRKPIVFRNTCTTWDMRRQLLVDFASDDGHNAGESVIVIACGFDDRPASVFRYMRCRFRDQVAGSAEPSTPPMTRGSTEVSNSPSIFGGSPSPALRPLSQVFNERLHDALSSEDFAGTLTPRPWVEEWRPSIYALNGLRNLQILATAMDNSTFATQTLLEDPLLNFSARSTSSSPSFTPLSNEKTELKSTDVPGYRARLFAIGTQTGNVLVWNTRATMPTSTLLPNTIDPLRIIYTDSPQISCLALSSLYLVHGGNDGLVQTWDLLGSSHQPIRTLHSRFSTRARRRLAQAEASPLGVGINLFAAGAICLDPDPTVLRGVVSLGTQLRYWSYSSSAADQYKSNKRKLRRSERGSNNATDRVATGLRGNLKDYISNERHELDRERDQRRKEAERFAGRFGTDLMDGSEEEMIAYAAMLSQETLQMEQIRRGSDSSTGFSSIAQSVQDSSDATPSQISSPQISAFSHDAEFDADLAEAIRQSLETPSGTYDIPIRQAKVKSKKRSSAQTSPTPSPMLGGTSQKQEASDLEFALHLSLAEEHSRQDAQLADEFPALDSPAPKKGKAPLI